MDDLMERVEPASWGAVVTDSRFPRIWDANYARVDEPGARPDYSDLQEALGPALERAGAGAFHVVMFRPEEATDLIADLSSRGHKLSWDVVMAMRAGAIESHPQADSVEELPDNAETWSAIAESLTHFGIDEPDVRELVRLERDAMGQHKRWFGVRDQGAVVAIGALVFLQGIGYVDNVVTVPRARNRGYASALTARIATEAHAVGASGVYLLAEPEGPIRLYEKLGFSELTRIAGTIAPLAPKVA